MTLGPPIQAKRSVKGHTSAVSDQTHPNNDTAVSFLNGTTDVRATFSLSRLAVILSKEQLAAFDLFSIVRRDSRILKRLCFCGCNLA